MPAKATIFNLKCESVFDFGTGPRNAAYFNAQGSSILFIKFLYILPMLYNWNHPAMGLPIYYIGPDITFLDIYHSCLLGWFW